MARYSQSGEHLTSNLWIGSSTLLAVLVFKIYNRKTSPITDIYKGILFLLTSVLPIPSLKVNRIPDPVATFTLNTTSVPVSTTASIGDIFSNSSPEIPTWTRMQQIHTA